MFNVTKKLGIAAIVALGVSGMAKAATVTIAPVLDQYFVNDDALNNNTPSTPNSVTDAAGTHYTSPGIYEVAITVSTSLTGTDTAAGFTGFGNAFLDMNQGAALPAGLTANDEYLSNIYDRAVKYNATGTKFAYADPVTGNTASAGSGATPGTSMFSSVSDNGTVGDLKGLAIALGTGVYSGTDPRLNVTQSTQNSTLSTLDGNPLKVFDIFVNYDGTTTTALQPYADPATEGFGLHNNTTGLTTFYAAGTPGQTYTLSPMLFGPVPEPASLGLLAFGAVGLIRRRRQGLTS